MREWYGQGVLAKEIAARLGRTEQSVRCKLSALGIARRGGRGHAVKRIAITLSAADDVFLTQMSRNRGMSKAEYLRQLLRRERGGLEIGEAA